MTTTFAVPPDLIDAVDDVFAEEAECSICERLATVIGTLQPCGHTFQACTEHRRQLSSHVAWRAHAGKPLPCAESGEPVLTITWEPRA